MQSVGSPLVTERQLQVELHDYVRRFSDIIEAAADEIGARSGEPEVQRRALLWKMNAIPACQSAAFDADPVIALVDTWALMLQMREYFEHGAGKDAFGEWQPLALEAVDATETQIADVAAGAVGEADLEAVRAHIEPWAADNPLQSLSFRRATVSPLLARKIDASRGLLAVTQGINDRVDDVTDRLTIYAEALPEQARWQAQLLVEDTVGRVLDDVSALTDQVADQVADLVEAQWEAVFQALAEERAAVVEALDQQRIATLSFAREERQAVFAEIDAQRTATLAMMQGEREATFAWLDAKRVGIAEDVRHISAELLDKSLNEMTRAVDHALLRAFLLGSGAVLVLFVALLALLRTSGRGSVSLDFSRRAPRDEAPR